jgi:antitoxin MazE
MEVIVKKWGNSAAVRIPAAIMVAAHVALDQPVEPVRRKEFKLDKLIGGITGKNLHQPIDTGAPIGKEIW